jgi:hypothetical protein
MLPLNYGVMTFDIFFIYFSEQNEEPSSTADYVNELKCVEGKCVTEPEETTENPDVTEARRSKHSTALQCFDVF